MAVVATYALEIDLNNGGTFGGGAETVTANVATEGNPLVITARGASSPRSLARPEAGSLTTELNNGSDGGNGTYSPGGNLVAGRRARFSAVYGGNTYRLWSGNLRTPIQSPWGVRPSVSVTAYGVLSALAGVKVSTALYSSITTDVAIGYLFDAAGLTAPTRTFDTGKTTLLWYWEDEADAFEALQKLLDTEGPGAYIYEAGDGSIVFKKRTARAENSRSNTSQATFSGSGSEPLISFPYEYDPGIDTNLFNACSFEVKKRTTQALQAVWALGETVELAASEVRTYVATGGTTQDATTGQYIGLFTGAVTPSSGGGDYTVTVGSLASVVLDRTSGASCKITLTAGASGATVTGLRLRAQPVTTANTTQVTNVYDASASIAKYGTRPWPTEGSDGRPIRPDVSSADAQAACDAIVGWHLEGRPTATATLIANGHTDRMTQALSREIGDRVTLVESLSGVNNDFYIERVDHEVSAGAARHVTKFALSQALARNYGIWDLSKWDGGDLWAW